MKKTIIFAIGAVITLIGLVMIPSVNSISLEIKDDKNTNNPKDIKTPIFQMFVKEKYCNSIRIKVVIRNPNPFRIWVSEMCFVKGSFDFNITTPSGKILRSTYPSYHILPTPRPIPAFGKYYHIFNLKYYNFSNYKFNEEGEYKIKAEYGSLGGSWNEDPFWRGYLESPTKTFYYNITKSIKGKTLIKMPRSLSYFFDCRYALFQNIFP